MTSPRKRAKKISDREMLDWIGKPGGSVEWQLLDGEFTVYRGGYFGNGKTLRSALRAAIRAERLKR